MEEIDPRHLLIKVSEILDRLDIPYAITGGMAVFLWARPRFTADIDIVVLLKDADVPRLAAALRELGNAGYIDEDMMRNALERHSEFNFIDGVTGVKVDFSLLVKGPLTKASCSAASEEKCSDTKYILSPRRILF